MEDTVETPEHVVRVNEPSKEHNSVRAPAGFIDEGCPDEFARLLIRRFCEACNYNDQEGENG